MATTKLNNGQLPTTLSSKTIDNTNDINTTTTRLKITGGSNGQVLSTDGAGNLSWATAGGGVSDGDKGDITVASSGTVWTIDNDAVTYAKIQNVSAASRILGRGSASGSGDVQELTIGSGLELSGTTLSALGAPIAVVTKTTDETVTSSTTLQDDDELQYALTSGKSYYIQLLLMVSRANSLAGNQIKYGFAGNSNGSIAIGVQVVAADGTSSNNALSMFLPGGVPTGIVFNVTIKATANFTGIFKFAQGTSNTTGVTIMAGSRMEIYEVA